MFLTDKILIENYRYDLNGWKYWTMGCPLHNCKKTGTVVINRAKAGRSPIEEREP